MTVLNAPFMDGGSSISMQSIMLTFYSGESGKCDYIPYAKAIPKVAQTKAWKSLEVNGMLPPLPSNDRHDMCLV